MLVEVNWYRPTGKWYADCTIELPNEYCSDDYIKQAIVEQQNALSDEWIYGDYYVVLSGHYDELESQFVERLYLPDAFLDVKGHPDHCLCDRCVTQDNINERIERSRAHMERRSP